METVTTWILNIGAVVLALLILATLVRAVLGPRFTDRIVAVNVIGTLVIAELMVLSVRLRAGDTLSEAAEYFCVTEDFLRKACELYLNMGKTFAGTEGESV